MNEKDILNVELKNKRKNILLGRK